MKTYLLSFPRSGSHWVRFIVEWFSGCPTLGCTDNPDDTPICQRDIQGSPLRHVNPQAAFILEFGHRNFQVTDDGRNRLLFLLRNYKECVTRHYELTVGQVENRKGIFGWGFPLDFKMRQLLGWYLDSVRLFHSWKGEKCFLYYEDLMSEPRGTIAKMLNFLKLDDESKKASFFERYEEYFDAVLRMGGRGWDGSASGGRELVFHQKKLPDKAWRKVDSWIKRQGPDLIPYLERYWEAKDKRQED